MAAKPVSPAKFTRRLPEAMAPGPDAPETIEPTTGRPRAGGHGPPGPGGPTMSAIRRSPTEPELARNSAQDSVPDAPGALGVLVYLAELGLATIADKRRRGCGAGAPERVPSGGGCRWAVV
jgi:hypothetical protein